MKLFSVLLLALLVTPNRWSGVVCCDESSDAWAYCISEVAQRYASTVQHQLNVYALGDGGGSNFWRDLLDRLLPSLMEQDPLFSVNQLPYELTHDFNPHNLVLVLLDDVQQFVNHLPVLVEKNVELRGYFLLVVPGAVHRKDATLEDASDIAGLMRTLWDVRIHNVLVALGDPQGTANVNLFGYAPYGPGCCGCSRPVLLDRCQGVQLENGSVKLYDRFEPNLYGCELRIACFERDPFMRFLDSEGSRRRLAGIEGNLVELLAERLNFHVTVVQPRDGRVWGHIYSNGTADGALGLLLDGTVHLTLGGYFPYPRLLASTTQSHNYYQTELVLAVPEALATVSPFGRLLKPFRWPIWAVLACELVAGIITLRPTAAFTQWRAFIGDSLPTVPLRNVTRVVLLLWVWQSTVLRECYKGSLVGFLTAATPLNDIRSLAVLLAAGYRVAMTAPIFHQVFDGDLPRQDVHDRLQLIEPGDGPALLERTIRTRDRLALAYTREEIIKFNERDRTAINYRTSDETLLTFHFATYFKRSSPVATAFDWYIRRIVETGFVMRWHHDNLDMRFQRPTLAVGGQAEVLHIHHLLGGYLLLLFGLLLATVGFTLEVLWKRYNRQRRRKMLDQRYPYLNELRLHPQSRRFKRQPVGVFSNVSRWHQKAKKVLPTSRLWASLTGKRCSFVEKDTRP